MKNILTFIIPVRHQNNANDWKAVKRNLTDTARSIANQDHKGWKAVVVANYEADLPDLPVGFEVKRVDFPPNQLYRQGKATKDEFHEAVRRDKGRRILAGMLHAGEMGHVMVVDDDDFVNRRLTSFVAAHTNAYGWYIRDGYIWEDGGVLLYSYHSDFSRLCGTSHIVRADLYNLPATFDDADEVYIRRMLGSHHFLHDNLNARHKSLEPLPFIGAIYRTGHPENHSLQSGIFVKYFLHKWLLKSPFTLTQRLLRLRFRSRSINNEFFGI